MLSVSSNEAKQSFGRILDAAQREPVVIRKHRRSAAVVLSVAEFDRLRGLNADEFIEFCDSVGHRAAERGLTEEGLDELLNDG